MTKRTIFEDLSNEFLSKTFDYHIYEGFIILINDFKMHLLFQQGQGRISKMNI